MATAGSINNLKAQIEILNKINVEKLTRTTLGEESLAADLEPRLKKIDRLKKLTSQYAEYVHDEIVNNVTNHLSQIATTMNQQAARANQEFIGQRQPFLNTLDSLLEGIKRFEMH